MTLDFMKFHTSGADGLKSGQFNHQKTVPFWRSFTRGVSGENEVAGLKPETHARRRFHHAR
jgi:hypothetical protein